MNFHTYIKAVGTGPKGNRDLTFEESRDAMQQILSQSIYPEQSAAFLLGWRLKPETIDEFRGAISTCDGCITAQVVPNSIELGFPYDGKLKKPYLFPLVAQLLKNSELNLVVSGDLTQPAKNGITTQAICQARSLPENLHYFDRKEYFPQMHALTETRKRLGVRTGINTIEKLNGVGGSDFGITSLFHKPYVEKYMRIFGDRYKRFALIQGSEGSPELFSKGRLWITEGDSVDEYLIDPEHYGIDFKPDLDTFTFEDMMRLLDDPSDDFVQLARLNAAVYLFVANKAESVEAAFETLNTDVL